MTPTPEMVAMAERIADSYVVNQSAVRWRIAKRAALTAIMEVSEMAARVSESAFDDRHYLRCRHHSEMDWTYGYRDATRAVATAIRNGEHLR